MSEITLSAERFVRRLDGGGDVHKQGGDVSSAFDETETPAGTHPQTETELAPGGISPNGPRAPAAGLAAGGKIAFAAAAAVALAGCAQNHARMSAAGPHVDSKYGVSPSPRVVAEGQPVPKGGGRYQVGKPYQIAGQTYVPSEHSASQVGLASWYGRDFHGRRTANGEVFDSQSFTAAHPTMPLPSYARVTNLRNNHSMIVRVNDRGPYHGGRVMDVSRRVAEALEFKDHGTARVKIDYLRKASLSGSDDRLLLATLRTDGTPASIGGGPVPAVMAVAQARAGEERSGEGEEAAPAGRKASGRPALKPSAVQHVASHKAAPETEEADGEAQEAPAAARKPAPRLSANAAPAHSGAGKALGYVQPAPRPAALADARPTPRPVNLARPQPLDDEE